MIDVIVHKCFDRATTGRWLVGSMQQRAYLVMRLVERSTVPDEAQPVDMTVVIAALVRPGAFSLRQESLFFVKTDRICCAAGDFRQFSDFHPSLQNGYITCRARLGLTL